MLEWLGWILSSLPRLGSADAASIQGYASMVQAAFAVVAAGITVYAVRVARRAWITAAHQRHDALMPLFKFSLASGRNSGNTVAGFGCRLENIGQGPALSVQLRLIRPRGEETYLVPDDRSDPVPISVLVPVGESHTFQFLDNRLLQKQAAFEAELASRGQRYGTNEDQKRFIREWNETQDSILSNPFSPPFTVLVDYEDVYGRPFRMDVSLLPTEQDEDRQARPGRIKVGQITHKIPYR